ncbi:MAG: HAMP domain-containing histidine kinase, partial [Xanthomonadales bacterium]|nr:HAMP domain-containing histidine kinase [Xanthomonadales bacterium]
EGDSEQAIALIEEALVEAGKEGSRSALLSASISQALVLKDVGRLDEAQDRIEQAATHLSEGHAAEQAYYFDAAARVALARGRAAESESAGKPQFEHALALYQRAADIAERVDDPARRARVAALGSEILAALGRWRESRETLQRSHAQQELADERLGADRSAVLTARYLSERDQRELAELRRREVEQNSELARQRGLAVLLGMLVLLAAAVAAGAWRRARERRQDGVRLQAHIDALERALDDAEQTRRSAQHLAATNNRLLQLAGDELRTPSLQIRNTAERVLVEHTDDTSLARQIAAVAQAANEILRTSEQMVETGRQPRMEDVESTLVDVGELARGIADDVSLRLRSGTRKVLLDVEPPCLAAVDGARLQLVLQELIQIAAELNPGQDALGLRVFSDAERVILRLDDPRQGMQRALERGTHEGDGAPGSLGLLWLDRVLESLGGRLATGPQVAGLAGSLELRLPRGPAGHPKRQRQSESEQH